MTPLIGSFKFESGHKVDTECKRTNVSTFADLMKKRKTTNLVQTISNLKDSDRLCPQLRVFNAFRAI